MAKLSAIVYFDMRNTYLENRARRMHPEENSTLSSSKWPTFGHYLFRHVSKNPNFSRIFSLTRPI